MASGIKTGALISGETTGTVTTGLTALRVYKLLARTVHLIATGSLLGGHMFGAPLAPLRLLLYLAILTGIAMCTLEAYPNRQFFYEGWALLLWLKFVLLTSALVFWGHRVPILIAVVVIASIGSHMPRALRHWTPFHKEGPPTD
jgi:hypothetical protein